MEINVDTPISADKFKDQQAAKYAGDVPEEEKMESKRQIESLKDEISCGE